MDNVLKSLYIRLDANSNNLTSSAIGQILVKIIYSNGGKATKKEIIEKYADICGKKKINVIEVTKILDSLVDVDIKKRDKQYYLSTTKFEKIKKAEDESKHRKEEILDCYFEKLFSSRDVISDWLQDISILFFQQYSDDWISDLVTSQHAVLRNEASIKDMVLNRTKANKNLDKRDLEELPKRFFNFVGDNKSIVDDYLWEYGTSAFAAKLITNTYGVNSITLDAFRNSKCIFDTNILLFIALDSRFREGIVALEKVFEDLNIEVGYLYITKKEYQDKVLGQYEMTKHNIDVFGYNIASFPDDDFTSCAKSRGCRNAEDFDVFFNQISSLPEYVHDKWPVKLMDNDSGLVEAIDKAQADESKKNELNTIYRGLKGRDKRQNALLHDIGLLEGVEYLRKSEKYFIISEETCVNSYSKKRPSADRLPLAIRIDTLINVLAANNGGDTFEASNYVPLFANIIRSGLTPQKKTFEQEELFRLYDMDQQIAQLPEEEVKDIALEMHDLMMQGTDEKELRRILTSRITKGKIKSVTDLESTRQELTLVKSESERNKDRANHYMRMLQEDVQQQEEEKYDDETKRLKRKYRLYIPAVIAVISVIGVITYMNLSNSEKLGLTIIVGIAINVFTNIITNCFVLKEKLNDRTKNRENEVAKAVENKMEKMRSNDLKQ